MLMPVARLAVFYILILIPLQLFDVPMMLTYPLTLCEHPYDQLASHHVAKPTALISKLQKQNNHHNPSLANISAMPK